MTDLERALVVTTEVAKAWRALDDYTPIQSNALLVLAFGVSTITLGTGRTHFMQGAIHPVIFAAFLFLTLVP